MWLSCFYATSVRNKACVVFDSEEQDASLNVADHFLIMGGDLYSVQIFSVELECLINKMTMKAF